MAHGFLRCVGYRMTVLDISGSIGRAEQGPPFQRHGHMWGSFYQIYVIHAAEDDKHFIVSWKDLGWTWSFLRP